MKPEKRNHIAQQEVERIEQMVARRAQKLADAKRKLKAAQERAK
jgi:hypothetical protein